MKYSFVLSYKYNLFPVKCLIFVPMKDRKLLNIELGRLSAEAYRQKPESGIVLILDNIRSAHNVGSAFRTADAFGVDKIYLGGICPVPPSPELRKVALGAEEVVPFEHVTDVVDLVRRLQADGYTVIAVEQTVHSVKLDEFQVERGICSPGLKEGRCPAEHPARKYALIFGNEVDGVQQSVVDAADFSLEIPQQGTKHSLNVSVSIGVVLWGIR
jgi:tRNA G18 (ribose-2'-O)-methylase SpoU